MQSELMTGYLNSGVLNPLSRITIGSLQDLGYSVDYAAADSYGRGNLNPSCTCNQRQSLSDMEHGDTHQFSHSVVPNTARRALSQDLHNVALAYGQSILDKRASSQNFACNDGELTYIGDKVVSVIVTDGAGIFSVVVRR